MSKETICCFTGHRPQKLPWGFDERNPECQKLKTLLREQIESKIAAGVTTFISGMALGTDIWAAEIVNELKRTHSGIKLIAAIPCQGQEQGWSEEYKGRYAAIRAVVDEEVVLHEQYTRSCMQDRNRYMVDRSAYMIAVFNGEKGGTKSTIEYAHSKGLEITIIDPNNMGITAK